MRSAQSTAVSTRSNPRVLTAGRPSARTAMAAFVGALVVGILGMHALSTHGSTPAPAVVAASSMALTGATHTSDATMNAGWSAGQDHSTASDADSDVLSSAAHAGTGSGHDMRTMVMLCVVMLAAAALTLLVLLAVRIVRPLLPAAFHPAVARSRATEWVRGTGPPHVWAFSVIRC